jgi:hypothetical protein
MDFFTVNKYNPKILINNDTSIYISVNMMSLVFKSKVIAQRGIEKYASVDLKKRYICEFIGLSHQICID